eukprot:scaffold23627_cov60-Phaeocystis_antarctica.AAC.5
MQKARALSRCGRGGAMAASRGGQGGSGASLYCGARALFNSCCCARTWRETWPRTRMPHGPSVGASSKSIVLLPSRRGAPSSSTTGVSASCSSGCRSNGGSGVGGVGGVGGGARGPV